jgi:hypothetical protein
MVFVELCFIRQCHKIRELCRLEKNKKEFYIKINQDDPDNSLMYHVYEWIKEKRLTTLSYSSFVRQTKRHIYIMKVNSNICRFYWLVNSKTQHKLLKMVFPSWAFFDLVPIDQIDQEMIDIWSPGTSFFVPNAIVAAGVGTVGAVGGVGFLLDSHLRSKKENRKARERADKTKNYIDQKKSIDAKTRAQSVNRVEQKQIHTKIETWIKTNMCFDEIGKLSKTDFVSLCRRSWGKDVSKLMQQYELPSKTRIDRINYATGSFILQKVKGRNHHTEITEDGVKIMFRNSRVFKYWRPDQILTYPNVKAANASTNSDDFTNNEPNQQQMISMLSKQLDPESEELNKNTNATIKSWLEESKSPDDSLNKAIHLYIFRTAEDPNMLFDTIFYTMSAPAFKKMIIANAKHLRPSMMDIICRNYKTFNYFQDEFINSRNQKKSRV